MNKYVQNKKVDFDKAIEFFKKDISVLRTGRANPSLLDGIQVDAYGTKTLLNGLASVTVPEPRSIVIAPWDKSILKAIEKSIIEANLGFNPVNEGDKIRISMPIMTEENRKELVKNLNEKMEKGRISIRKLRDEVKVLIEIAEKNKEISEDDKFRFIKELDEESANRNNEIKEIKDKKEKEIMTI